MTETKTTARTATGNFLGFCSGCRVTVLVGEKFTTHAACGSWVTGAKEIKARNTDHECGAKCTSATGPNCDCTCAGQRHGIDHR